MLHHQLSVFGKLTLLEIWGSVRPWHEWKVNVFQDIICTSQDTCPHVPTIEKVHFCIVYVEIERSCPHLPTLPAWNLTRCHLVSTDLQQRELYINRWRNGCAIEGHEIRKIETKGLDQKSVGKIAKSYVPATAHKGFWTGAWVGGHAFIEKYQIATFGANQ